jgi:hypothetical protein
MMINRRQYKEILYWINKMIIIKWDIHMLVIRECILSVRCLLAKTMMIYNKYKKC